MKHTRGPWKYVDSLFIDSESGLSVAQILSEDIKDRKEFIANAKLIAAAPEMLELIEKLNSRLDELACTNSDQDLLTRCYSILKKVRGE